MMDTPEVIKDFLKNHPWIWALLFGLVLGWGAAYFVFAQRIEVLKDRHALLEAKLDAKVEIPSTEGKAADRQNQTLELKSGQILATHYRTGDLFALALGSNTLVRVSALLEDPRDMVVRPGGEIIVLEAVEHKVGQIINFLTEVDHRTGVHRRITDVAFLSPKKANCLALGQDPLAFMIVGEMLYQVQMDSGEISELMSHAKLGNALSMAVLANQHIAVTTSNHEVLLIEPATTEISELSSRGRLFRPRGVIQLDQKNLLVGTAGEQAGIVKVNLSDGAQEVVALGPFFEVTDIAIESQGTLVVADNGSGRSGNGFVARVDPLTRQVDILVSQTSTDWSFSNGRSVALFP